MEIVDLSMEIVDLSMEIVDIPIEISWFTHEMAMFHSKLLVCQRKIWKVLVILIIDYRSSLFYNESLLVLPEEFNSNHEEFDIMIPQLENYMLFFLAQILLFLCFTIVDVDSA